jgi:hypothetical protein
MKNGFDHVVDDSERKYAMSSESHNQFRAQQAQPRHSVQLLAPKQLSSMRTVIGYASGLALFASSALAISFQPRLLVP